MGGVIRRRVDDGVAFVTLDGPDGNALTPSLLGDLHDALAPDGSRALVLAGARGAFCSGMSLGAAFDEGGAVRAPEAFRLYQAVVRRLRTGPTPTLARVEGPATGGGLGLAAACDLVIASPAATFALSEVVVGMIPAIVSPPLLERLGPGRLRALAVTARSVDAAEARAIGLVDLVTDDVSAAVRQQLARWCRCSPEAVAATRALLDRLPPAADPAATALAALDAWVGRAGTAEGVRAFAAGDAPPWFARWRGQVDG